MYKERRGAQIAGAFAAFMTPMAVLIIIYATTGIHPFGARLLLCPANAGWTAAFSRIQNSLAGGSLAYSFSGGLGGELYGDIASSLSSPFWLFAALTGISAADALPFITIFQAGLAGLFSYLMLVRLSEGNHLMPVAFAVGYASGSLLCLSFLAPQFSDAAVLLPLVGAGISSLCDRDDITLLTVGTSLYMLTSPRLWTCLIIFMAVYFSWYCMTAERGRPMGRTLLMLMFVIMISAGISMITSLPGFLFSVESGSALYSASSTDSAAFGDLFAALFPGAFAAKFAMPLTYIGTASLIALMLYFFNGRIFIGERQAALFFVLFILLSMAVPALGWLWLGFTAPTGSMIGMSFVLCAFLSALATREFSRAYDSGVGQVFGAWLILALIYAVAAVFANSRATVGQVIFSAAFMTLMAGLALIHLGKKGSPAGGFFLLMAVLVAAECAFGGYLSLTKAKEQLDLTGSAEYAASQQAEETAAKAIAKNEEKSPSGFYRVRGEEISGCVNVGVGSSGEADDLLEILGISDGRGYTPVTDALFGVKYNISPVQDGTILAPDGDRYICARGDIMPIGYAAYHGEIDRSSGPFAAQNSLASYIAGVSRQLFSDARITGVEGFNATVTPTSSGGYEILSNGDGIFELSVLVPADGDMYMYLGGSGECTISAAGQPDARCILGAINRIGSFERGAQINVDIKLTGERLNIKSAYFAVLDESLTKATMSELGGSGMQHLDISGSRVRGTIELKEGQILLTSIPYSDRWSVEIDGARASCVRAFGGLLAVSPPAGLHSIDLRYRPQGMIASIAISALSLLLAMIVAIAAQAARQRREKQIRARMAQQAKYEEAMMTGATIPITDEVSYYRDRLSRRRPVAPYIDDEDIEGAFSEPDPYDFFDE